MPIKSKAQRRKFAELLVKGEISPEVYERWNRGAGYKELPERVTPKDKRTTKAKRSKRSGTKAGVRKATTGRKPKAARRKTKTSSRSRRRA